MSDAIQSTRGSVVDAAYASGEYFADPNRYGDDAAFKANEFLALFRRVWQRELPPVRSYADIGCGSGHAAAHIAAGIRAAGMPLVRACGFDVSPHVATLHREGVAFVHGDFIAQEERFDLVTLIDVAEHVADPLVFLREIARRARYVGLHLPLDATINLALRDKFRARMDDPGHILLLDMPRAINLLTMAGLRPLDYAYTLGYRAPSGRTTPLSKATIPLKALIARISPWLLSVTLGNTGLMVIAASPHFEEAAAS